MTIGPRSLIYQVNGGPLFTLNAGGGSFNIPAGSTVPVQLKAGLNSIQFGNPTSFPPDLDRIVISGDGSAPAPHWTAYEAELGTFTGSAGATFCSTCSGTSKAGNLGGPSTITFTNVNVPEAGMYELEVDYLTSGPRSYFVSVNGGTGIELDLNGSSFSLPTSTVIPITLQAGANTIRFGNPNDFAPDLDRIALAKPVGMANLSGTIIQKRGSSNLRVWQVSLTNNGTTAAHDPR